MSYGLLALLDDIAALAKLSASSLDDIAAQSLQTGTKSIGIVIDDTAVTPTYVAGMSPAEELPAIAKIVRWSLFNKIVVITPLALLFSVLAPWILPPVLLLGGFVFAFEGTEKVLEITPLHASEDIRKNANEPSETTIAGAIRTDFILSTEIMVVTLGTVVSDPLTTRLGVMIAIAVAFTLGVYGVVALIVRADDIGLHLAREHPKTALGRFGRALVRSVTPFLNGLTFAGTLAMLWVGGGLILHGAGHYGLTSPEVVITTVAGIFAGLLFPVEGLVHWLVSAFLSAGLAFLVGSCLVSVSTALRSVLMRRL